MKLPLRCCRRFSVSARQLPGWASSRGSDGLSSFAKLGSGFYTDRLPRRKPIVSAGYLVTALATASFALATAAWHILIARAVAWLGRGVRTPVRKALLAGAVDRAVYGRASIVGPLSALWLLAIFPVKYRIVFVLTLLPGLVAAALIILVVQEKDRTPVPHASFGDRLRLVPRGYRRLVIAVGIFGAGAFAHTLLILLAIQRLTPSLGAQGRGECRCRPLRSAQYLLCSVFLCSWFAGGPVP